MQSHVMSLRTIWSISFLFWGINKCQPCIDFILIASAQYNSSFMNKILVPSPVFRGNDNTMLKVKLCKVYYTLGCQQGGRNLLEVQ